MSSPLGYDGGLTLATQVSNLDHSLKWYTEVLGFEQLYRMDDIAWAEVKTEVAGVNIGLSQVEEPRVGHGPVPTFGVLDIASARAKLEAQDVRFDGDTVEYPGMVRLATFYDPDGNALMLFEDISEK